MTEHQRKRGRMEWHTDESDNFCCDVRCLIEAGRSVSYISGLLGVSKRTVKKAISANEHNDKCDLAFRKNKQFFDFCGFSIEPLLYPPVNNDKLVKLQEFNAFCDSMECEEKKKEFLKAYGENYWNDDVPYQHMPTGLVFDDAGVMSARIRLILDSWAPKMAEIN